VARVVVFGSLPESLLIFRGPLMRALVAAGYEVHAVSPTAGVPVVKGLEALGGRHHAVPLQRTNLNPVTDVKTLFVLWRKFTEIAPGCVLPYTVKPVVYGCLAARWTGVPRRFVRGLLFGNPSWITYGSMRIKHHESSDHRRNFSVAREFSRAAPSGHAGQRA